MGATDCDTEVEPVEVPDRVMAEIDGDGVPTERLDVHDADAVALRVRPAECVSDRETIVLVRVRVKTVSDRVRETSVVDGVRVTTVPVSVRVITRVCVVDGEAVCAV